MSQITSEELVRAWTIYKNSRLVAEKLGLTQKVVTHRISRLRLRGVDLPRAGPEGRTPIDVAALNRVVDDVLGRVKKTDALPNPSESPKSSPPKKRAKPYWSGILPPELQVGFFPVIWARWLDFRKNELKKPVTQLSGDQALKELAEWGPERARKAIEHTIARGWQGIREPEVARPQFGKEPDEALERGYKKVAKELGL